MKIENAEEIQELKAIVEKLCKKHHLIIQIAEDNYFKIFTDQSSGITLFLQFDFFREHTMCFILVIGLMRT